MSMRARMRASRKLAPMSIEPRRLLIGRPRKTLAATVDLAQKPQHQLVVLGRTLERHGVPGPGHDRQPRPRNELRQLARLPGRNPDVLLGADHVHGHPQATQPVPGLVARPGLELASVALPALP